MLSRRIVPNVIEDLDRKMVFLSGPRQCGKTTVARQIVTSSRGHLWNWDSAPDRLAIQKRVLDFDAPVWAFDELHKNRRWRGFLKDIWDAYAGKHRVLVTGSARLDVYGRGGDSLQGRYFHHHLHPLTLSELVGLPFAGIDGLPTLPHKAPAQDAFDSLLELGGFPEPLLGASAKQAARWRLAYAERLVREDVASLESIRELERVELLYDRLTEVAGGILSINSLREDLEVAFDTVRSWLLILEKLGAVFRLSPYGPPRIKAVKKAQKLYFWDWPRCATDGARFENMLAAHLWRFTDWMTDVEDERVSLRFFRHRDGQEVDFVLLRGKSPWMAIEAKLSDDTLAPSLRYFAERAQPKWAFQVVKSLPPGRERRLADIGATEVRVVSAARFLAALP